jgi:TolB protein
MTKWMIYLIFLGVFLANAMTRPSIARAEEPPPPPAAVTSPTTSFKISVGDAALKKSLMAVPPFVFEGAPPIAGNHIRDGKEIYDVFLNDMSVSGFFEFVKPDAYLESVAKVGLRPAGEETNGFKYETWKQIGTEFLIRAGYNISDGKISLTAYLYFVSGQKRVFGRTYKGDRKDVRRIAHTFANDVVKELTSLRGMFFSKIVATRNTVGQIREVFTMDWDGANSKQVSNHKAITVSPAWSSDGSKIVYSAFAEHKKEKRRNLDMFTYDIASGKRFLVSYRKGINSGASFLPKDAGFLLTISNAESARGNPDIYRMSSDGSDLTRLTEGPRSSMNIEPALSPDGTKIAFSSDRSGLPMIYIMNLDGTDIKRITFAGSYNSTPRWSPDGKRIVFAGYDKDQTIKTGHFDLFSMDADGTNMIRLTSSKKANSKPANNESPSFSPDGRQVLFLSDRSGNNQLYLVSADGQEERRITFDKYDYSKPIWSGYID